MRRHNIIPSDEAFWQGDERCWAWVQQFPLPANDRVVMLAGAFLASGIAWAGIFALLAWIF